MLGVRNMYKVYQVQGNDTLMSIASKLGLSVQELANLNGLMVGAVLMPGEYIIIPNSNNNAYFENYTIKKGDTIYNIARERNLVPSQLLRLNGLNDTDVLYVGDVILLPRKGVSFYVTEQDDTLDKVSKKLNASANELARQNDTIYLTNDQLIVYKTV